MDNTKFTPDKPVELYRQFISRTRNIYQPGVYSPGTLPESAYTTAYCKPNVSPDELPVAKVYQSVEHKDNGDMKITPTPDYQEIAIKPEAIEAANKVTEINLASKEEIEALPGVGSRTAEKIVELREQSPFINLSDLEARVKLGFNRSWSKYNLAFSQED